MPLHDADALDPLVVAPVVHEPLTWPEPGVLDRPQADALDALRESYPYRFFLPRSREEAVLRLWLQGAPVDGYALLQGPDRASGSALRRWLDSDVDRALPGGAALVTGMRGVGKTTLVRKVLFDVAVAARHGIRLGPWDDLTQALVDPARREAGAERWLYVPVRVDVASPITGDQLLRRIIRRSYLSLAAHGVGELHPAMMRQARTSYLRTLGQIRESSRDALSESLGLKTDLLAKLEVTAEQELSFARSLELVAQQFTVEEAEDELIDLGRTLAGPPLGGSPGMLRSALQDTSGTLQKMWSAVRSTLVGQSGVRVFLVYLLDELDKMPAREDASERLSTAMSVVRRLKTLLTVEGVLAVAIGGHLVEQEWNDDRFRLDAELRSIFSRHVYVPKLGRADVATFLARRRPTLRADDGELPDDLVDAACFVTRGRYKDLLRWAARHDDPPDFGLPEDLGTLLGPWGGATQERGEALLALGLEDVRADVVGSVDPETVRRSLSDVEIFARAVRRAEHVEDLVSVLIATTYRGASTTAFAADLARAVVLAEVELALDGHGSLELRALGADAPESGPSPVPPSHVDLVEEAARVLPRRFAEPLLEAVRDLVRRRFSVSQRLWSAGEDA